MGVITNKKLSGVLAFPLQGLPPKGEVQIKRGRNLDFPPCSGLVQRGGITDTMISKTLAFIPPGTPLKSEVQIKRGRKSGFTPSRSPLMQRG